jgi:Ca2+-binding EF-hand superfamily protein
MTTQMKDEDILELKTIFERVDTDNDGVITI